MSTVIDLITAAGALVRFLPPYIPDLNLIEEAFGKVKSYIRDNQRAYQNTTNPRVIVASAFASVTKENCKLHQTCWIHRIISVHVHCYSIILHSRSFRVCIRVVKVYILVICSRSRSLTK